MSDISSYLQWTSASGAIPVISGEFGNAGNPSSGADPDWQQGIQGPVDDTTGNASTGASGYAFWEWNCGCDPVDLDTMVDNGALVDPYGTEVQQLIAQGSSGTVATALVAKPSKIAGGVKIAKGIVGTVSGSNGSTADLSRRVSRQLL